MSRPLAIDLFCGLGGWSEALLATGWDVVGFDIEAHEYAVPDTSQGEGVKGTNAVARRGWTQGCAVTLGMEGALRRSPTRVVRYPAQLVIQDVTTLHGSQFRDAALIVASPPCQAYSYRAMPWSRAKALPPPDNTLFEACFRIQREACAAAGRHVPLIVENVRGAQKWVGRARWNFGSFYLWGDVPALMPHTFRGTKVPGLNWSGSDKPGYVARAFNTTAEQQQLSGSKIGGGANVPGIGWTGFADTGASWRNREHVKRTSGGSWFGDYAAMKEAGTKQGGTWWHDPTSASRTSSSKSPARKAASALIAKIPQPLALHIAQVFYPRDERAPFALAAD